MLRNLLMRIFEKVKFEILMEIVILGMNFILVLSCHHLITRLNINPVLTVPSFDDTICPVDFERNGQITSDTVRQNNH
jgi:hypothetical protein